MADTRIPDYVDARKIFAQQALIEGSLPLASLPRFSGLLADNEGEVKVSLRFFQDEEFRRVIEGSLEASISVLCQRCLEPMQTVIEEAFSLAVVDSEERAGQLPKRLDPWICEDTKLELANLVEEQLILAMPIVSFHAGNCAGPLSFGDAESESGQEDVKGSPFDVLKALKSKH